MAKKKPYTRIPAATPLRQKRTGTPRLPFSASLSPALMAALDAFAAGKGLNRSAAGAELLGRALKVPRGER